MAAPIGNQQSAPPAQAGQQLQEKGYIERLVIAIKDFIVGIFAQIVACFRGQAAPAPQQPQAPDPRVRQQQQETLNRLKSTLRSEDLLRHFNENFPTEADKEPVYLRLGQLVPQTFMSHFWRESYNRAQRIQAGKNIVERDPSLIIPHIIQKIETRINL